MTDEQRPGDASFGFRDVPRADKARLVRDVFDRVAGRYDVMNDLMSVGVHRLWKRAMINWLAPRDGMRLLDMASGTGDIAFRVQAAAPRSAITVADINFRMLEVGRDRAIDGGQQPNIEWICADAEALPFNAASFDAYTIAFGIRNMTSIPRALAEARRVLKPGGRFLCLEFSQVRVPGLDRLYAAYSFAVLPRLGQMVAGDADAYRYLAESIRRFPNQAAFAAMIAEAGLAQVKVRDLSGGIAALHSAWRL